VRQLLNHEALMQGRETWRFIDGNKTVGVNPRGRFWADNGSNFGPASMLRVDARALCGVS
jgi:hypothetical protein